VTELASEYFMSRPIAGSLGAIRVAAGILGGAARILPRDRPLSEQRDAFRAACSFEVRHAGEFLRLNPAQPGSGERIVSVGPFLVAVRHSSITVALF
jgi:hypothetical protein